METKYHINKKGQKAICGATQRKCRYSTHFMAEAPTRKQAIQQAEKKIQQDMDKLNPPAPIDLPSPVLKDPRWSSINYGEDYGQTTPHEWKDYRTGELRGDAVTYAYDSYETPEEYLDQEDGYGRNRRYENLRITNVNSRQVVADVFGCTRDDVPDSLLEDFEEQGFGNTDAFTIEGKMGYYGEEIYHKAPEGLQEWANNRYWSLPNAEDKDGVLRYLRGKGFDTTGKTPIEAVKAQLASENNGKVPTSVAKANKLELKDKSVNNIQKDQTKMSRADATPSTPTINDTKQIIGVITRDTKYSKLRLVDGHRRAKYHQDNARVRKIGTFLFLYEQK
jgi:hypothetical protein